MSEARRGPGLFRRARGLDDGMPLPLWDRFAALFYFAGLAAVGVFVLPSGAEAWRLLGSLALFGLAAFLAGALLGFLFGVPRYKPDPTAPPAASGVTPALRFLPNTNLEQISDWLTKIIVGASLVQIGPLVEGFGRLCVAMAASVGAPRLTAVVGAVLLLNAFAGFLWGYLWSSVRIYREMAADLKRTEGRRETPPAPTPVGP